MTERLLTTQDVADRLQVKERTVRDWIRSGELPAFDLGQGYRISEEDLEAFLEGRKRTKPGRKGAND